MTATAKKRTAKPRGSTKRHVKAKTLIAATAVAAEAAVVSQIEVGGIVMFTSSDGSAQIGPGRVCTLINFDEACVMFGDGIGCRRVFTDRLSLAAEGAVAPECVDCSGC